MSENQAPDDQVSDQDRPVVEEDPGTDSEIISDRAKQGHSWVKPAAAVAAAGALTAAAFGVGASANMGHETRGTVSPEAAKLAFLSDLSQTGVFKDAQPINPGQTVFVDFTEKDGKVVQLSAQNPYEVTTNVSMSTGENIMNIVDVVVNVYAPGTVLSPDKANTAETTYMFEYNIPSVATDTIAVKQVTGSPDIKVDSSTGNDAMITIQEFSHEALGIVHNLDQTAPINTRIG